MIVTELYINEMGKSLVIVYIYLTNSFWMLASWLFFFVQPRYHRKGEIPLFVALIDFSNYAFISEYKINDWDSKEEDKSDFKENYFYSHNLVNLQ